MTDGGQVAAFSSWTLSEDADESNVFWVTRENETLGRESVRFAGPFAKGRAQDYLAAMTGSAVLGADKTLAECGLLPAGGGTDMSAVEYALRRLAAEPGVTHVISGGLLLKAADELSDTADKAPDHHDEESDSEPRDTWFVFGAGCIIVLALWSFAMYLAGCSDGHGSSAPGTSRIAHIEQAWPTYKLGFWLSQPQPICGGTNNDICLRTYGDGSVQLMPLDPVTPGPCLYYDGKGGSGVAVPCDQGMKELTKPTVKCDKKHHCKHVGDDEDPSTIR